MNSDITFLHIFLNWTGYLHVIINTILQSGRATIVEAAADYIKTLEDQVKELQTLKQEKINVTETKNSGILPSAVNQEMPHVWKLL